MRISDWSSDVCSSDLISRNVVHMFVNDPGLDEQRRAPCRCGSVVVLVRPQDGGERADLGLAVVIPQTKRRKRLAQRLQNLGRHDRRAIIAFGDGREVGAQVRCGEAGYPYGRWREETGSPRFSDSLGYGRDRKSDVGGSR